MGEEPYFNLSWLAEICRTFSVYEEVDQINGYDWLEDFVKPFMPDYISLPKGANVLSNIRASVEREKERTRMADHGKDNKPDKWPLARMDFLDQLTEKVKLNLYILNIQPLIATILMEQKALRRYMKLCSPTF